MAKMVCEKVSSGLRDSEVIATLRDYHHRRHFIRVERDFLTEKQGMFFLPIGVVHFDSKTQAVLVELPHESETGANRLWVASSQMDEPVEAFA